jgi:hypothetical protein
VLVDEAGNQWGSMYEVTEENTFVYEVTRLPAPVDYEVLDVVQDPGQTGGDGLRYSYADGKLTITQDSGKVPYVEAKEGFPPRGGNWVGVAVQYTETFEGDLYKLEVTKGETTTTYDQEILSETEQDRNELWYYFDAATTKQVTLKIYFTETDFEEVVIDAKDVTDLETKIEALLNGATGTLVEFTEDENETH